MPNLRSYSCRAKSTCAAHCFVQFLNLGEAGALDGGGDDLRYAVAAFDGERFVPMIDHDDLEFTAIIAVDGAGRIRYADAVLQRYAGTGADLNFIAVRDGDGKSGRHRMPLTRSDRKLLRRDNIHARSAICGVGGSRQPLAMRQALQPDQIGRTSCRERVCTYV